MVFIDNGKGDGGFTATVNKEGKLEVCAVTNSFQKHVNETHGGTYSMLINKTPTGADDCFAYLKNDSDDDMMVSSINLCATSDESIQLKINDEGTPVGGTVTTPTNRNAGSGNSAGGTFQTGVDITGLSGGDIVDYVCLDGAVGTDKHIWNSFIILPKGKTMSLYATTGGIALKGSITLNFH